MYEYLTIEECNQQLQELFKKYQAVSSDFKLCFVSKVEEEIWDYTPESKKFMKEDPEYLSEEKRLKEQFEKDMKEFGRATYQLNPLHYKVEGKFYPNPELKKGKYIAYFTNISLKDQWGDDWDDAPYEHNAGEPYDDHYEGNTRVEHTIKCVYFTPKGTCMLPEDYSFGGNSPFCVKSINAGAVAWLFNGKKAINASCGFLTFLQEMEDF